MAGAKRDAEEGGLVVAIFLSHLWTSVAIFQRVSAAVGARGRAARRDTRGEGMMMLKKLFNVTEQLEPNERALLASIHEDVIEDPAVLSSRRATLTQQLALAEREWAQLVEAPDPASFLRRPAVAERIAALKAEIAPLPARIGTAEHRRAAVLSLARWCAALRAEVEAQTVAVLEHSPRDPDARAAQLKELDTATRLHTRVAARLAALSSAREFVRVPDAVKVVRDARQAQVLACDRLRVPGMRQPVIMPPQMLELLDTAEGKTPQAKKEIA
jgi:hypothetical protein